MDRDFIWEADYGDREKVIVATKILLSILKPKSLQNISYFVNNNPYNFEFYVLASFDSPTENEIKIMKNLFNEAEMKYRIDITIVSLMRGKRNRQFNSVAFYDENTVELSLNLLFFFPERKKLEEIGYIMKPLSRNKEVFISHSSDTKNEIRKMIPYLNGSNHSVWFDEYSIEVGDSLKDKINDGIVNASVVIFWITAKFLQSDWCLREMELANKKSCKVIYCVDSTLEMNTLPEYVLKYKYLLINTLDPIEKTVNKIIDIVIKYY